MSNISSTAVVTLTVNGKQATNFIRDLEAKTKSAEAKLSQLQSTLADKKEIRQATKEFKSLQKQLEDAKIAVYGVGDALDNLSTASPRELERSLKLLNRQLKSLRPGSDTWDSHIQKIQILKGRLKELKDEVGNQDSAWPKFKNWAKDSWGAIDIFSRGISVLTGRLHSFVDSYASMDQEMANVRKYTGMAQEQVVALNEEFKKMDTRTSREDLNRLAQEAGRLGKSSVEDVLGFVRAADKINVALDDLGDGATLTLSKLTGIFGDEDRLGTEQALLSVGSVVNELSQNCAASAPYLTEFASRLGGVGSTAGMSVQQIMAFGAVLDTNNQSVEASSTALAKLITHIYQAPSKFAKVAGLDVANFTNLVKTDMNAALMELFRALHDIGDMNVIAPMLKDMGENASGALSTITTLADNIDALTAQQLAANEAFEKATSIDEEYAVQNNTLQSTLEKAKNKLHELAIAVGEALAPVLSSVYSALTGLVEPLKVVINFLAKNTKTIAVAGGALAIYYGWLKLCAVGTYALTAAKKVYLGVQSLFTVGIKAGTALLATFKLGLAGVQNAVALMSNGFQSSVATQTRWRTALSASTTAVKGLGAAIKATPIGAFIGAAVALYGAFSSLSSGSKSLTDDLKSLAASANVLDQQFQKEKKELDEVFDALKTAEIGSREYQTVKDKIVSKYGVYLNGLINERGEITNLTEAYNRLTLAAERSAKERAITKSQEAVDNRYFEEKANKIDAIRQALIKKGYNEDDAAIAAADIDSAISIKGKLSAKTQRMLTSNTNFGEFDPNVNVRAMGVGAGASLKAAEAYMLTMDLLNSTKTYNAITRKNDEAKAGLAPYAGEQTEILSANLEALNNLIGGASDNATIIIGGKQQSIKDKVEAMKYANDFAIEVGSRTGAVPTVNGITIQPPGFEDPGDNATSTDDRFKNEKASKEMSELLAFLKYQLGMTIDEDGNQKRYTKYDYDAELSDITMKYFADLLKRNDLTDSERVEYKGKYVESKNKADELKGDRTVDEENISYTIKVGEIKQKFIDKEISASEYQQQLDELELAHYQKLIDIVTKLYAERQNSWAGDTIINADIAPELDSYVKLRNDAENKVMNHRIEAQKKAQKQAEDDERKSAEERSRIMDTYLDPQAKDKREYDAEIAALDKVYNEELALAEGNEARILQLKEAYCIAKLAIAKKYNQQETEDSKNIFQGFNDWLNSDGGQAVVKGFSAMASGMSSVFSSVTDLMKADLEAQTAAIEKRYDKEIETAQGHAYKTKKLEKKKEEEIAKLKAEAARKQFAMQVIMAVAQTAQNALSAYGSAAAIPVVGHILAPIAAAMAIAAGMIQIATIKKQQQASEAQGYAEGGFTRPGRRDEVAGVVHAGEWVASQKLVNDRRTRPLLEALDYAQRNNTIGSITSADVSRSIAAPMLLATQSSSPQVIISNSTDREMAEAIKFISTIQAPLSASISRLNDRLEQPIMASVSVTGEHGIENAYDEYNRLMQNKSKK